MLSVRTVSRHVQHLLTTTADEAAAATGCVRRKRRFSGASLCQTLVLGWLGNPAATLDQLCQMAAACGVQITPQGLAQRFTPAAAAMLKRVLDAAIEQVVGTEPVAIPLLRRFAGVFLQDCTVITLPAELAEVWAGCGDATATGHSAVLKAGVRLDLAHGALHGPVLAAGRTHDRTVAAALPPLPPNSLRLADLGFFSLADLAAQDAAGCFWLTRVQVGTAVFDATGRRWELAELLEQHVTGLTELAVEVGVRQRLSCRLIAVPVPDEVANARRRRMHDEAHRRGQEVTADRLRLAAFTVFITNVPVELLSPQEALVLARARWQIELLFKCWKSVSQVDQWRSQEPYRILCEVYAKLIGVVIQHWLLLTAGWDDPRRSLVKAAAVVREAAFALALALQHPRRLPQALADLAAPLQAGCRKNTRRAHPGTYQLLQDPEVGYDLLLAA
jgi:hypothetical protein